MIFVTVGSQKFQFNRLLEIIDELVKNTNINEEIFAQTGYSDYQPKYFQYKNFLDREEFENWEKKADIIITHGGTGAIVGAVKNKKKVIAISRLARYGEHVDDHQKQIITEFNERNLIYGLLDLKNYSELKAAIEYVKTHKFNTYISNTQTVINSIEKFIRSQVDD